jgi:hypothetical protein
MPLLCLVSKPRVVDPLSAVRFLQPCLVGSTSVPCLMGHSPIIDPAITLTPLRRKHVADSQNISFMHDCLCITRGGQHGSDNPKRPDFGDTRICRSHGSLVISMHQDQFGLYGLVASDAHKSLRTTVHRTVHNSPRERNQEQF